MEAATKITDLAEKQEATQRPPRHAPLEEGDLVLLRRFILAQHRGSKLEARWEGPYVLTDLAWHGRSGRLQDLNTGEVVRVKKGALCDRVHLNNLKVYLKQKEEAEAGVEFVEMLEHEQRIEEDAPELGEVFG